MNEIITQKRIGGLFDDGQKHQAGSVWDKRYLAPTIDTMRGGYREPLIVESNKIIKEIIVLGNYMPSNHDASRVVSGGGVAPTVKENHGTVTAVLEKKNARKSKS